MLRGIFALVALCMVVASAEKQCQRAWTKVGCFKDDQNSRVYPTQLANNRDPGSSVYTGDLLRWDKFPQSLKALACECHEKAKALGHKLFALQFWGECWSGPESQYWRVGQAEKCVGGDFKDCNGEAETECVGMQYTNYVYQVTDEPHKTEKRVDGKWGDWSEWSHCDKKCGGGQQIAERLCNNPAPSGNGAPCVGEGERTQPCNEEACETVCRKQLEIGMVLDASGSVKAVNFEKMKDFFKNLVDEYVVKSDMVHFGSMHYSYQAWLDWKISDQRYWSPDALKQKIDAIPYPEGGTRTDKAMDMARKDFFCTNCGLRSGAPKVLVVVTDGKSRGNMVTSTRQLKEDGVKIIAIGVTKGADQAQLKQIASTDDDVINIPDFKYMQDKLNLILGKTCPK